MQKNSRYSKLLEDCLKIVKNSTKEEENKKSNKK